MILIQLCLKSKIYLNQPVTTHSLNRKDQHFNDKTSTRSKPWFNNHCRQARKKYYPVRRIYNINKTHQTKEELLATSRNYKREINKSITNYKRMMRDKLRQMKQNHPNTFGIINDYIKISFPVLLPIYNVCKTVQYDS